MRPFPRRSYEALCRQFGRVRVHAVARALWMDGRGKTDWIRHAMIALNSNSPSGIARWLRDTHHVQVSGNLVQQARYTMPFVVVMEIADELMRKPFAWPFGWR